MAATVSILIPTMFDSRYLIELCLKSITKHTAYPNYKIIVCDAGVDQETYDYLSKLTDVSLIKATERPKDDLVKAVDTEYYVIMHDDIYIKYNWFQQKLKYDWLQKRLDLMNKDKKNAIVGTIKGNYNRSKRFFPLGLLVNRSKRFFPLGLLVRTEVSRKLGLKWGKHPKQGFDTGAIAYNTFFAQQEYKFVKYNFNKDIYHFSRMTWPKNKNPSHYPQDKLERLLKQRKENIRKIREMLDTDSY